MSIVRIIVIDPQPRDPSADIIVYQVPEHSRALELLIEMLDERSIEHVELESKPYGSKRRKRAPQEDSPDNWEGNL